MARRPVAEVDMARPARRRVEAEVDMARRPVAEVDMARRPVAEVDMVRLQRPRRAAAMVRLRGLPRRHRSERPRRPLPAEKRRATRPS